jgi:FtsH-binding integral membrane protein
VIQALVLTAAVFVALTLFTMQSKIDFSFLGAALFAALWILIIWGFINAIFGYRPSFVYSLLGAIIFSLYIVYDTWLITNKLSYDDWVIGKCIERSFSCLCLFVMLRTVVAAVSLLGVQGASLCTSTASTSSCISSNCCPHVIGTEAPQFTRRT